jgi:MFS family permease
MEVARPTGERGAARRWWTLGFALLAVTVTVIDNTVLTVSIPRIMRDLHSNVAGVQWVFTGYALVFASLLVVGGRLGDMYGARRLVIIGSALFGAGSLVASVATSMPVLIVGEAVIEGTGAALLAPNTLAVIARTFEGRQRAVAYAAWATVLGAASSLGPVLGGYLTSDYSWRWSFRINLVIAPVVMVGMAIAANRDHSEAREQLDIRGAALVASGTFLIVFGLTQGNSYGWWTPTGGFSVVGHRVWPAGAPISPVPGVFVAGLVLVALFVRAEVELESRGGQPLFEFSRFRLRTFRLTNVATFFLAFAQLGTSLCIALYLQESRHLSPLHNGLWVFPLGLSMLVGAPVGGWVSRSLGATNTLRLGSLINITGLTGEAFLLPSHAGYWAVLPCFIVYGVGAGFVSSQLNRILLHDVAPEKTGAASGVNSTARQTAAAMGVATMGAVFAAVANSRGVGAALRPSLLTAVASLVVSTIAMWRLPQVDRDERPAMEREEPVVELDPV